MYIIFDITCFYRDLHVKKQAHRQGTDSAEVSRMRRFFAKTRASAALLAVAAAAAGAGPALSDESPSRTSCENLFIAFFVSIFQFFYYKSCCMMLILGVSSFAATTISISTPLRWWMMQRMNLVPQELAFPSLGGLIFLKLCVFFTVLVSRFYLHKKELILCVPFLLEI